jgi:hypothetical protein
MPRRKLRCSSRCSGCRLRAGQKSGFARGRLVHRQPTRPGPISEAQEQRPRPSRPRQRRRVDAWLPALRLRRRYNPARRSTSAPRPWRPQQKFHPTSAPPLQLCRERWPDAFGAGIKAIRDFAKPADLGVKRAGLSSTRSWPKLFQRGYRLLCFVKALAGAVKAFDSLGERYPCRRNWF